MLLVPFSTTLDLNVLGHFYFKSYHSFSFSVQMFPSSDRYPSHCEAFQHALEQIIAENVP